MSVPPLPNLDPLFLGDLKKLVFQLLVRVRDRQAIRGMRKGESRELIPRSDDP
jgi:hypothetical protein